MEHPTATPRDESPGATGDAAANYLAPAKQMRQGIALCLSGGGYRAALFHLGAARRLNELGVLGQVDTITSVSGGSIFAAFLAQHLAGSALDSSVQNWEERIAKPLRAFTRRNIRAKVLLAYLHPKTWIERSVSIEALAEAFALGIKPLPFHKLPAKPRLLFCSTDIEFGAQWVFDSGRRRAGSEPAGYAHPVPADWTLTRAVAASSSFPGLFVPLRAVTDPARYVGGAYQQPDRDDRVRKIVLSDGGVYDNLGVEQVWRDHRVVLVSDAAPTFATVQSRLPLWRGIRYPVLLLEQVTQVRKRWLIANFLEGTLEGAYWGIGSLPSHYGHGGQKAYSDALITERIARVRIDLDAFSDAEIAILENHGYIMADLAVQRHLPHLVRAPRPLAIPHPAWMGEHSARRALRYSDRMGLLGRGLAGVLRARRPRAALLAEHA